MPVSVTLGGVSAESQWQCLPLDKPQPEGPGICARHCLEGAGVNLTCSRWETGKVTSDLRAPLSGPP